MAITKNEVEYVANLSRLKLSEEEADRYTDQLDTILNFIQKLDELDTSNVEPTSHALNITNVYREDKVRDSIPREMALKNAPKQKDGQFRVPPAIEG